MKDNMTPPSPLRGCHRLRRFPPTLPTCDGCGFNRLPCNYWCKCDAFQWCYQCWTDAGYVHEERDPEKGWSCYHHKDYSDKEEEEDETNEDKAKRIASDAGHECNKAVMEALEDVLDWGYTLSEFYAKVESKGRGYFFGSYTNTFDDWTHRTTGIVLNICRDAGNDE